MRTPENNLCSPYNELYIIIKNKNKLQNLFCNFATDAARTSDKKDIDIWGKSGTLLSSVEGGGPWARGRIAVAAPWQARLTSGAGTPMGVGGPLPPAEWPEFGLKGQTAKIFSPGRPNQTILHSRINLNITFFAKSLHSLTEAICW